MSKKSSAKKSAPEPSGGTSLLQPVVARLCKTDNPGRVLIEYKGGHPVEARLLSGLDRRELTRQENIGRQVLVVFEGGDPELPIIVGVMEKVVEDIVSMKISENDREEPVEAVVDGKKIEFCAREEVVLRCGKASIRLTEDGKIIVRGTNLVSRASGTNKIRGGSIELN